MTLRYTQSNAADKKFAKIDQRGRHDPTHKTNQLELYKRKTKVSLKVFRQIFNNDFNIGFHMPKKDKCTLCESRKQESAKFTEVEECAYQKHLKDKEENAVHATIERFVNKRIIWAPSEWSTIISNARINPKPFQVVMLKHSDFLSWKSQNILPTGITKTLDGSIFQFNQVKIALFEKGKDEIQVQYSYSDSADILVLSLTSGTAKGKTSRKLKNASNKLEAIYPQPLKISHLKYRDLMQLCEKKNYSSSIC
ncbi:unnamed protein product [Psylliodes chrysocephalus]|uniref:Uncharacterized protein n=1 Tax=Psylliodes chrysocephalus TaxID=3402493 RepID=A0A9P0GDH2_9CUCU|nr:unnamed protein product [Psylliodes chrysocephala]